MREIPWRASALPVGREHLALKDAAGVRIPLQYEHVLILIGEPAGALVNVQLFEVVHGGEGAGCHLDAGLLTGVDCGGGNMSAT